MPTVELARRYLIQQHTVMTKNNLGFWESSSKKNNKICITFEKKIVILSLFFQIWSLRIWLVASWYILLLLLLLTFFPDPNPIWRPYSLLSKNWCRRASLRVTLTPGSNSHIWFTKSKSASSVEDLSNLLYCLNALQFWLTYFDSGASGFHWRLQRSGPPKYLVLDLLAKWVGMDLERIFSIMARCSLLSCVWKRVWP